MDSLLEFLPLLIFAVYALLRNRKAQQRKAGAAAADGVESAAPKPSKLEAFLRQLEEAAAEASGEPNAKAKDMRPMNAAPAPDEPSRFESDRRRTSALKPEFQQVAGSGFEHDRHGFGAENPLSEVEFQRRPPQSAPPPRTFAPTYQPHKVPAIPLPLPSTTAPRRAAVLAERLRHPDAARDAIVLNAIFQRPGDRNNRHR